MRKHGEQRRSRIESLVHILHTSSYLHTAQSTVCEAYVTSETKLAGAGEWMTLNDPSTLTPLFSMIPLTKPSAWARPRRKSGPATLENKPQLIFTIRRDLQVEARSVIFLTSFIMRFLRNPQPQNDPTNLYNKSWISTNNDGCQLLRMPHPISGGV